MPSAQNHKHVYLILLMRLGGECVQQVTTVKYIFISESAVLHCKRIIWANWYVQHIYMRFNEVNISTLQMYITFYEYQVVSFWFGTFLDSISLSISLSHSLYPSLTSSLARSQSRFFIDNLAYVFPLRLDLILQREKIEKPQTKSGIEVSIVCFDGSKETVKAQQIRNVVNINWWSEKSFHVRTIVWQTDEC